MRTLAYLIMFFGALWCLLGGYYFWLENHQNNLTFENYHVTKVAAATAKTEDKQSTPKQIMIDDLNIELPLIRAKVEGDKWETTHNGASYLSSSPIPGNTGNSIVYGHNWTRLFGNLVYAKPGQAIKIAFDDGSVRRFVIKETSTVLPTASNILDSSTDKRITLYTCTGFLDSKRFVVVATLDENPSFADVNIN